MTHRQEFLMQTINPSFVLDAKDIDYYQEAGFVVLRNYLSQDMVLYLREKVREQLKVPTDNYQKGFSRLGYDLCDGDENIYALLREPAFRSMMSRMSGGKRLFFTQGVGFEMKKLHSKGFEWHIESQSFGFHRTEDYATTIWIPLHRIDTKGQRGGMRYVPKNIISGEYMYSHVDPAVFRCMEELIAGDGISFDDYKALRDGPLNSSGMNTLLEYFAVEDDYELGDILLIDKYVIHRSVMLDDGELETRDAFSLRFICETSRYDYHRAHMIEIPRNYYGYPGPTKFHLDICKQDGELIVDSPFFHDREARYVVA
jgi:hypothetical protein